MNRLKQDIGLLQGIGLMFTTLLGTGIFVVPAITASIAGKQSLLAWGILILLVIPIAFTFALLGKKYPHAGSTAFFVRQAFGNAKEKLTTILFISTMPVQ